MTPIPQYLSPNTLDRVYQYMRSLVEEGNFKVLFKTVSQRSLDQNDKLQAMCMDIANQIVLTESGWCHIGDAERERGGEYRKFNHNDMRHILMAGFTKAETVPGIEPEQTVCLYPSTTELSLSRCMDFITYIQAFADEMGVKFTEE